MMVGKKLLDGWKLKIKAINLGYLFIAPAMIYLFLLIAYPIAYNIFLSFFKSSYGAQVFVGFKNYLEVFTSRGFFTVMKNTVIWTAVNMTVMFVIAMIVALILDKKPRGATFFTVVLLLPWVIPGVVAGILWRYMLQPRFGIINDILIKMGIIHSYINWLGSLRTSLGSVIVTYIWKVYPYIMILIMAGLKGIPQELYEAAMLDGAGSWQKFIYITLPQLSGVIQAIVIIMGIWTFNSFDLTYIMTKGGPLYSSEILAMRIYNFGFSDFRLGLAATASVIAFTITFIFAALYIMFIQRK